MFVRKKSKADAEDYHQLVESVRVDGKPRQRVVLHLGRHATVDAALKGWPREVRRLRRDGYPEAADALLAKRDRLARLRDEGRA